MHLALSAFKTGTYESMHRQLGFLPLFITKERRGLVVSRPRFGNQDLQCMTSLINAVLARQAQLISLHCSSGASKQML